MRTVSPRSLREACFEFEGGVGAQTDGGFGSVGDGLVSGVGGSGAYHANIRLLRPRKVREGRFLTKGRGGGLEKWRWAKGSIPGSKPESS